MTFKIFKKGKLVEQKIIRCDLDHSEEPEIPSEIISTLKDDVEDENEDFDMRPKVEINGTTYTMVAISDGNKIFRLKEDK